MRAAAALLMLPLLGCGAETTASSEADASAFTCTALATEVGHPRAYFAPFDALEQEALCVLDQAQHELLVAHYNIRRDSYLEKLVALKERGVDVRVAVDATQAAQAYNTGDDYLEAHGIPVVRVKPAGSTSLMHLKVAVVDGSWAMTGSFNWNGTAALANDENMLVLRDPEVVTRYRAEVREVLGETPRVVNGGPATEAIELHFCPEEKLDTRIAAALDEAAETIDVAMFELSRKPIADALVRAARDRGVRVRVVLEKKRTGTTSVDEQLEAEALVVRGANTVGAHSAMHHKYGIVDGKTVITGAANWTTNGTRQSEEDILIVRQPELAAAYRRNFADLLWVYAGIDDPEVAPAERAGVLFYAQQEDTAWGDRLAVVGNHPALGGWDPRAGLELETNESLFPSWTGRTALEAGAKVEYKFVTLRNDGKVVWEPGDNRVLSVPATGRGVVVGGPFGDTSTSWTPHD